MKISRDSKVFSILPARPFENFPVLIPRIPKELSLSGTQHSFKNNDSVRAERRLVEELSF